MAESAHERIRIDASPARCWEVATDYARYPEWAKDVKQATVLESDADGRAEKVEFRAAAMGKSIRYVLEYDYSDAPEGFSWQLVEGEMIRRCDGRYEFQAEDDGTQVTYDLAIELAMPLPGFMKRRAAGIIIGNALPELKREVERE